MDLSYRPDQPPIIDRQVEDWSTKFLELCRLSNLAKRQPYGPIFVDGVRHVRKKYA